MNPWNDESGDWRGLATDKQRPRYQAIAAQIEKLGAKSVLDIGSGEAVFSDFLPANVTRYLGVEPSATAVKLAESRKAPVVHATAEDFTAESPWDCIVFNEMLYYATDPIGLLRKYAKLLTPDGAIIVSIFQRPGRPSLKMRLRHWMDRRRPMSNIHCTEMVLRFIKSEGWVTRYTDEIHPAQGNSCWRVLVVKP